MSNRWGIPPEIESYVLKRDLKCVYCGIPFSNKDLSGKTRRTWEHIINDVTINGSDNIALCCGSCNASKGNKKIEDWMKGKYCITKNINQGSVASVVKSHLEKTVKVKFFSQP